MSHVVASVYQQIIIIFHNIVLLFIEDEMDVHMSFCFCYLIVLSDFVVNRHTPIL